MNIRPAFKCSNWKDRPRPWELGMREGHVSVESSHGSGIRAPRVETRRLECLRTDRCRRPFCSSPLSYILKEGPARVAKLTEYREQTMCEINILGANCVIMHAVTYACMYACTHAVTYACMYACMHAVCMHVCTHACARACMRGKRGLGGRRREEHA